MEPVVLAFIWLVELARGWYALTRCPSLCPLEKTGKTRLPELGPVRCNLVWGHEGEHAEVDSRWPNEGASWMVEEDVCIMRWPDCAYAGRVGPIATIDWSDEARNLYGCAPCTKCGGEHVSGRKLTYGPPYGRLQGNGLVVECSDCGFIEPAKEIFR